MAAQQQVCAGSNYKLPLSLCFEKANSCWATQTHPRHFSAWPWEPVLIYQNVSNQQTFLERKKMDWRTLTFLIEDCQEAEECWQQRDWQHDKRKAAGEQECLHRFRNFDFLQPCANDEQETSRKFQSNVFTAFCTKPLDLPSVWKRMSHFCITWDPKKKTLRWEVGN